MHTSEEDISKSCEDDFETENDTEGNPELEESDGSSDGMIGKARRHQSDEEFKDLSKYMRRAPYFVDAARKKQIILHQCFKDYKEFNDIIRDDIKICKKRVAIKYKVAGCPFRVHASLEPDNSIFVIKTLRDDTLARLLRLIR
ncbi:hypothetical protein TorRG33x02_206740 [Trema orientale]|uniref:Transposase MuDR plant domain-containing protein n=1 Tax=Trema orientale TaxID=63057 RepID=A0A2P5ED97_TREOI|nr:hypothetical protein TorRG33x02_206740 [Trema orientale]